MYSQLFSIDPMAGISYSKYNSIKGEDGSFLDFLLHYDSYKANHDDDSWFGNLLKNELQNSLNRPQMLKALNTYNVSTLDFLSSKSYFDTRVETYKTELLKEMKKRDIPVPTTLDMPLFNS